MQQRKFIIEKFEDQAYYKKAYQATSILVFETIGSFILTAGFLATSALDFSFACVLFGATLIAHPFSGAHLNPIVTLGHLVEGSLDMSYWPLYIIGQLVGSFLGGFFAWLGLGLIDSPVIISANWYVIMLDIINEALGSFLFMTFVLIFTTAKTQPIKFNLIIFLALSFTFYVARQFALRSGGFLNPAITLNLSILRSLTTGSFKYLRNTLAFLIGQALGTILAGLFFSLLFLPQVKLLEVGRNSEISSWRSSQKQSQHKAKAD